MEAKVTRFAGVAAGPGGKKRQHPAPGAVEVTEFGLAITRCPEPRDTWRGHSPANPIAWQETQVCRVFLDAKGKLELAQALLASLRDGPL